MCPPGVTTDDNNNNPPNNNNRNNCCNDVDMDDVIPSDDELLKALMT